MKLIKELDIRPYGKRNKLFCLFICPYCNKKVEKEKRQGESNKSCGCIRIKHNESRSKLYVVWRAMKMRCYNKTHIHYKYYGGRGIKVCNQWRNSYEEFRNWAMNNGYKKGLTLDRKNNNQGYRPLNCRWVTRKIQQRNTRWNRKITYKDETHCVSEWAEILGINKYTIASRLYKGMGEVEALTTKIDKSKSRSKACRI